MARDWKALFTSWSKPPTDTETDKADRAARMIRQAIEDHEPLQSKVTSIYGTGSYANNTNTRLESDIDVAVVLHDCFFSKYPVGKPPQAKEDLGHSGHVTYGLRGFGADVGEALNEKFGRGNVTLGSKAYDVHANTVRIDADVAVFLEHRRYTGELNTDATWKYLEGVEMRGSGSKRIINWHHQHHRNGVDKNKRTGRRYKRTVRILKRLRDDMNDKGSAKAQRAADVPSFLLECLAFNAADSCYEHDHVYDDAHAVIAQMWTKTKPETKDLVLREVSRLKWLFHSSQPWTKAQAHAFLLCAWQHVGFKK